MDVTVRFLTLGEVVDRVGLSRTTIYARVEDGLFPRPVKLSKNRNAWLELDVLRWQQALLDARDARAREQAGQASS